MVYACIFSCPVLSLRAEVAAISCSPEEAAVLCSKIGSVVSFSPKMLLTGAVAPEVLVRSVEATVFWV